MTSNAPLVSVITPSYNAVRFIEGTIRSVQDQTYSPIEHIVVDGGSNDGTVDVLRKYSHLKWVSEPDRGQSDALNKGLARARGEIVGWLNADDTYNTSTVDVAVGVLQANSEVSIVFGDCALIDEDGEVTGLLSTSQFDLAEQVLGNRIPQPTVFLRRTAIEACMGVDENLHYVMDYDLWLRLAAQSFEFARIPSVLANFRVCDGTKSQAQAERFWPEIIRCYDRFFSIPSLPSDLRTLKQQAYDRALWQAGLAFFAAGNLAAGEDFCRRAIDGGRLLETEPEWAVAALVEQAFGSNRGAGEQYALTVLHSLNLQQEHSWFTASFAPARLYEALAFVRQRQGDRAGVRRAVTKSLMFDRSRLHNLGLVMISVESFVGVTFARLARRAARMVRVGQDHG